MRKLISIFLSIICILVIMLSTGCSFVRPESIVTEFVEAGKKFDFVKMAEKVNPEKAANKEKIENFMKGDKDSEEDFPKYFIDYFKENASKITYKVKKSVKEGKNANVTVYFKYVNGGPVLKATIAEVFAKAISMAFTNVKMSDEEMGQIFATTLKNQQEAMEETFIEKEIDIKLVKVDKKWYIDELSEEILDVFTSNFLTTSEDFNSSLNMLDGNSGETSQTSENSEPPTFEYTDSDIVRSEDVFGALKVSAYSAIKNTSDYDIVLKNAYMDYEDNNGKLLSKDSNAVCIPEALKPGQVGYIYSNYHDISNIDLSNGLKIKPNVKVEKARNFYELEVSEVNANNKGASDTYVKVIGRGTNNTDRNLSFIQTSAVLYDKDGKIIGLSYDFESFDAGETKSFEISGKLMSKDYKASDIARTEVFIQGDSSY